MLFLLYFSVVFSHWTVQASVLHSVLDFSNNHSSDNQLLFPTKFLSQPTSSYKQLSLIQITSAVTSSYTYIRLCNFMKFCLAVKNTRARSFCFWREYPDARLQVRLTPAGHAVCGQCPSMSFYRFVLNILNLSHYLCSFWNFRLFIIHFRNLDYSLFLKATTPLFIIHFNFFIVIHYSLFRFHPRN